MSRLDELKAASSDIVSWSPGPRHQQYIRQETLRFITLAECIMGSGLAGQNLSYEHRTISHILIRSLLENFFKILYVNEDPNQTVVRFNELVDDFADEYRKMYNDQLLPDKGLLEQPPHSGIRTTRRLDLNSKLAQIVNSHGQKYMYLYLVYRISSFDTHGNTLSILGETLFQKPFNFPVLTISKAIELIADYYYCLVSPHLPRQTSR
jgi:hypothetical protein